METRGPHRAGGLRLKAHLPHYGCVALSMSSPPMGLSEGPWVRGSACSQLPQPGGSVSPSRKCGGWLRDFPVLKFCEAW